MSIKRLDNNLANQFEFEVARQEPGTVILAFCQNPNCGMLHVVQVGVGYILIKNAAHCLEISKALAEVAANWDKIHKDITG